MTDGKVVKKAGSHVQNVSSSIVVAKVSAEVWRELFYATAS